MKDSYFSDDISTHTGTDVPAALKHGMRHSIRPRRTPTEVAKTAKVARKAQPKQDAVRPAQAKVVSKKTTRAQPVARPVPASAPAAAQAPVSEPRSITRWNDLALAEPGVRRALTSPMPVIDASRDSDSVRAFDLLRTRLRQVTTEKGWINIGITAPTAGCGTTFTAVNLALSLSRIAGSRTALMDMNLRRPGVAAAFDIDAPGGIGSYLSGETAMQDHMVRASNTLALGLSNRADPNAAEILQDAQTKRTLEQMRSALRPQLVIYDLPPMLAHDDVTAFAPQLDGVLLVSDGTQTMSEQVLECERMLKDQTPLLGVVLNRARTSSIQRYS